MGECRGGTPSANVPPKAVKIFRKVMVLYCDLPVSGDIPVNEESD